MKVLVDAPIWSYALRSKNKEYQSETNSLASLIRDQRAIIIGPIRQEILSGYSDLRKFRIIKKNCLILKTHLYWMPIMSELLNLATNAEKMEFRGHILIF